MAEDTVITPLSRTVGETGQVVDELIISFTHDCEMPAMLPGVAPTGRKVMIPFVVVVGFDGRQDHATSASIGTRPRCWCSSGCSTRRRCR